MTRNEVIKVALQRWLDLKPSEQPRSCPFGGDFLDMIEDIMGGFDMVPEFVFEMGCNTCNELAPDLDEASDNHEILGQLCPCEVFGVEGAIKRAKEIIKHLA